MGITQASLTRENMQDLLDSTRYEETEINEFFKKFIKDHPNGWISIDEFRDIYRQKFPNGDASLFAEHVFSCIDLNGDGELDFREFLIDKFISSRGDINQKIEMTFSLYDLDKNGSIAPGEMANVYTSVQKALGRIPEGPSNERMKALKKAEREAITLFEYMDKNEDGCITYNEFRDSIMANKEFKEGIRDNPKLFP